MERIKNTTIAFKKLKLFSTKRRTNRVGVATHKLIKCGNTSAHTAFLELTKLAEWLRQTHTRAHDSESERCSITRHLTKSTHTRRLNTRAIGQS